MEQVQAGISQRLIAVARNLLGPGGEACDPFPARARLSDLGISSLKLVNLMLAIEIEFDIAIPQAEITPENFYSLASVEALVSRIAAR